MASTGKAETNLPAPHSGEANDQTDLETEREIKSLGDTDVEDGTEFGEEEEEDEDFADLREQKDAYKTGKKGGKVDEKLLAKIANGGAGPARRKKSWCACCEGCTQWPCWSPMLAFLATFLLLGGLILPGVLNASSSSLTPDDSVNGGGNGTSAPVSGPISSPTPFITLFPSVSPTLQPSVIITAFPTSSPISETASPTASPIPIVISTPFPSFTPTISPTQFPTASPTLFPTTETPFPTVTPTLSPTEFPSISPTPFPTSTPTVSPTQFPSSAALLDT